MICKHKDCTNEATYGNQCQPCRNYVARYGMTTPDVLGLLKSQGCSCALCGSEVVLGRYAGVVDHNHKTGAVRGILCHTCNTYIGYIENMNLNLDKIKEYLTK